MEPRRSVRWCQRSFRSNVPIMNISFLRGSRRVAVTLTAVAAVGLGGAGIGWAAATATAEPAIKTSTPRSEKDVTNIDVLRQQLRNYYGDPLGTGTFAADSNYAKEASRVAADANRYLAHAKPAKKHTT